jgi:hypothetical protein
MTIASAAILLLVVVPLLLLLADVMRGRRAPVPQTPRSRAPGGVPRVATPTPAPTPAPTPDATTERRPAAVGPTAIRPGEGMVYRGPALGVRR